MSGRMKTVNLVIEIKGSAVTRGMDVFELAPSLLAMGTVIRESNRVIGPIGRELGINIRPFAKGSFIIDIALFAQSSLQQVMQLLNGDSVTHIRQVLEVIGLIVAASGHTPVSLMQLLKWLNGPAKKMEELESGKMKVTSDRGDTITIEGDVGILLNNLTIQQNIYPGYKSLEKEGIDVIESSLKDSPKTRVQISKENIPALKAFAETGTGVEEEIDIPDREVYLRFKRGSFEGDPAHWSFSWGSNTISATIKDRGFLEKIRNGEIRPNHLDQFKVVLRERQKMRGQEHLSSSYEVIQVKEYKEHPSQSKLFPKKGEI